MNKTNLIQRSVDVAQFGSCPYSYGLKIYDNQLQSANSKLFPLANTSAEGGCSAYRYGTWKYTMYCPGCRQAEKAWYAAKKIHQYP